jgi:hypothetical protein
MVICPLKGEVEGILYVKVYDTRVRRFLICR